MADDQPMWVNNRAVTRTPGAAIIAVDLGNNFTMKGHHLSIIKHRQFDGYAQANPHKHNTKFSKIYEMFRYGDTNMDAIKLKLFPSSLFGVITTWKEMRQAVVSQFFPSAMFNRLIVEIRGFAQHPHESLVNAWLRMKDLLRSLQDHTHHRSVMTNPLEDLNMKKLTMPTEDIEDEDIKETTTIEVPETGVTVNQEMTTKIPNLEKTTLPIHQHLKRNPRN
nr:reverse transcriptase domain-containing protein [Tanacetum cinerariifolium]